MGKEVNVCRIINLRIIFIPVVFITLLLAGCQPASREALDYQALMDGFEAAAPIDFRSMAPPQEVSHPEHTFEGRLELLDEATSGNFKNVANGEGLSEEEKHLPEFDFEFVQSGDHLVPVQRGLVVTEHPTWNTILEPGRIWQEAGDQGFSRASFPFTLTPKNGNSSFNGTMTFLFDDRRVSKVWYQVTQETAASLRMDMWGLLEAVYHPGTVANADQIRQDFQKELAGRIPVKPIEQLARDFPGVDVSVFSQHVPPEHMTTFGLVVDGMHYRGGCLTRSGEYPYCESLRMASFSTAKTLFVSLAMMRMAQKYGPEVPGLLIKDYVTEAATSPGDWTSVTVNDVLDMATGNFQTARNMVDEEGRIFAEFFGAEAYADKIRIAFDWQNGSQPGKTWVYRSSDTFIAVAALQNFLRTKEGEQADLFNFIAREVYQPLGLGPGVMTTLRTVDDDWQGQPVGAMGLWWIPDDVAKLGKFLNVDQGKIGEEQILPLALLDASLQHDPKDRGVSRGSGWYNNAFWADRFAPAEGYACTFYVPYMAGYSGNIIALLPNGVTYYYFSDNRDFDWHAAVKEADKIRALCGE
jgi:CubicO group peptidase (beta-lactamase class C family)